jgi:hypothetical protein
MVGQGDAVHPQFDGARSDGACGSVAIEQTVFGVNMQMDKIVHRSAPQSLAIYRLKCFTPGIDNSIKQYPAKQHMPIPFRAGVSQSASECGGST